MRVVVIDPRRTPTCDIADLHLPLRAGTDVTLFNGLLSWLAQHQIVDRDIRRHAHARCRAALAGGGQHRGRCRRGGAPLRARPDIAGGILRMVRQHRARRNAVLAGRQSILLRNRQGQQHHQRASADGSNRPAGRRAVFHHRSAERDGRPRGGRARQHAGRSHGTGQCRASRASCRIFGRRRESRERPGLKAVELFEAMHGGQIKAVWIIGTNPVVSLPNADRAREALRRCELVVVSDCVAQTDTTALAHILLPAAAWGEKDGTVTNSERHISRQRSFLAVPAMVRPDWWMICQVAQRMGFRDGFNYSTRRRDLR